MAIDKKVIKCLLPPMIFAWSAFSAGQVQAQDKESVEILQPTEVIGVTPLHGVGLSLEKIPSNVQSATDEDIRKSQSLDLSEYMSRNLGGVSINEAQNNPLQPDVQFRGFVASPLLGLPQGLSVYQDGVRINEPFGDTVNWALIPKSAIASVNLVPGSNPLFGLNTLGGALSIQTKNGFSHPGTRGQAYGGSFSRVVAQAETGGTFDEDFSYYLTGWFFDEDGWRDFSPSQTGQLFANLGWRGPLSTLDLNISYADTDLVGNGAAPIQLLGINREAIFTRPDQAKNELLMFNLKGSQDIATDIVLDGNVYYRKSDIDTLNGDDSDFEECEDTPGFICEGDGGEEEIVLDQNGSPIAASETLEGATVNRSKTEQDGYGGTLQATFLQDIAERENQLILGGTIDSNEVDFDSSTELGTLDETRQAIPGGSFVLDSFTRVKSDTDNYSIFFSDTFSLTPELALTVSGRYNRTQIKLRDQLGTALNGDHKYDRFNPAAGATYTFSPAISLYAGYNESNRAPSPVELTCADPEDPCRLPNAFLSDPPLEQVVAKTWETGLRGFWSAVNWHLGFFRTNNEDDILFVSSGALTNQGFFDNVGKTRRQGIDLNLNGRSFERLEWFINYTYLDATFRENFTVPSANNPAAVDGEIRVSSGNRIPSIPKHLLKTGATFAITPQISVGGDMLYSSSQFFRGDEANLVDPVSGYTLLNLRGEYRFHEQAALFVKVDNVLDEDYETFGLFGDAAEVLGDEFDDPRFLSPGPPRAGWVGLRVSL